MGTNPDGGFFDTEVTENGVEVTEQKAWRRGDECFLFCRIAGAVTPRCLIETRNSKLGTLNFDRISED